MSRTSHALAAIAAVFLGACQSGEDGDSPSLLPAVPSGQRQQVSDVLLSNPEAPVPPQCYTRTAGRHNPCYTCHQNYQRRGVPPRMNALDDGALQGTYMFSDVGLTNHWRNLFVDRGDWLARISDEAILEWVSQDNYSALAGRLRERDWRGFIPDLDGYAAAGDAFDDQGFALDGSGWVAFNYKPFPGTFWPTNGSTDDVVIRLPRDFRQLGGQPDRPTYLVNLSLVEMTIKQLAAIPIPATDEAALEVDLDGDGRLGVATGLRAREFYVGDAGQVPVRFQQYPAGTELMHTVRYLGIDGGGATFVPPRMKELRYMRKLVEVADYDLQARYARERKDKLLGELPAFVSLGEQGMENGMGWLLQGYIEDYEGELRPQSFEETLHCMGCHAAVGVTIDQTFALARKVTGAAGWGYVDLRGMPDAPSVSEADGEILTYLRRAGGGSEFRENPEMLGRWFHPDGRLDEDLVRAADVHTLITPSRERALKLNKAYAHIVRHQSYAHGRDATWSPARNVFREVDDSAPPLLPEHRHLGWDIRLAWPGDGTGDLTLPLQ